MKRVMSQITGVYVALVTGPVHGELSNIIFSKLRNLVDGEGFYLAERGGCRGDRTGEGGDLFGHGSLVDTTAVKLYRLRLNRPRYEFSS